MQILMVLTFLVLFAIVLMSVVLGFRFVESGRKKQVAAAMQNTQSYGVPEPAILITRQSGSTTFDQYVRQFSFARPLEIMIQQAGLNWTAGAFAFYSIIAFAVGMLVGTKLHLFVFTLTSMIGLGLLFGSLPYLYLRRARTSRLRKIEEQFPACLDFLARSMRAGHAFSVSLEMLSEETAAPLGLELRQLFNEQNLGAHIDTALASFAERVPLLDIAYFAAAVTMQRESGGNLSEILSKLAYVIRERFRLRRQIRAASAHGRITGIVLTIMPLITVMGMMIIVPDYLPSMARDPLGRVMIVVAIIDQFIGYYVIHKIVNFKV
jgi:tight adherence protein B